MSDLQIYTSFVSVKNLKRCTTDLNLVPVFAMKKIFNSEIIGIYSGTVLHQYDLCPSNELYHSFLGGDIDLDTYCNNFKVELETTVDLEECIKKFELMVKVSNASGIVIMTYDHDPRDGYRPVLCEYFNGSGKLKNPVYEI